MSIPEVFFRETIDINRYSNAVSVDLVRTYNDVISCGANLAETKSLLTKELPALGSFRYSL